MELEKMDIEDLKMLVSQAQDIIKEKEKEGKRKAFQAIIDAIDNYTKEYGCIDINLPDGCCSCFNAEDFNINLFELNI